MAAMGHHTINLAVSFGVILYYACLTKQAYRCLGFLHCSVLGCNVAHKSFIYCLTNKLSNNVSVKMLSLDLLDLSAHEMGVFAELL